MPDRSIIVQGIAALVVASCSYDWSTGAGPSDAHDATAMEASAGDASAMDASVMDAMIDTQAVDTGPPTCATLLANVMGARANAKMCSVPVTMSTCKQMVTDECGCVQIVNQSKTPYDDAVAAYHAGSCTNSPCPGCGSTITGLCIASDASTTGTACSQ
jgi:hypothetical protein